jgi:hypothetical protein
MRTGEFPGAVFPGELQRSGVGRVVAENGREEKGQVGKTGFKWWRGEARNQPRSSQVFTVLPLSFGFECSAEVQQRRTVYFCWRATVEKQ